MKLSQIKANPNNPRVLRDEKFKKLKKSIEEFPKMMELRPIVIDENNTILGGNMRFRALQDLGYKEIEDTWVKKANELTEKQKQEFIIKDNVSFGEWNWDDLANEWDVEKLNDWGLDIQFEEIDEEVEEDDYEEPEDLKVDVVLGDLIEIGEHRLLCGDSTDFNNIEKLLNNKEVDFVFTDPMYQDEPTSIISIFELLNTKYFLIMATFKQCISFINNSGYNFRFDLVFNQKVPSSTMNKKVPYYLHKNLIYLTKDDTTIFNCDNAKGYFSDAGYYPSIIESSKNTSEIHGLTKNADGIKLILSGFQFNSVLDLFLGSGSTMVASHQLKRKCYGMELDPKYCQVIIDRMLKLDNSLVVKINGKNYKR